MVEKAVIMDARGMGRALDRIAHEIVERNDGVGDLALIGIWRRGVPLANMIADRIHEIEKVKIPVGRLDITFYRDDLTLLNEHPVVNDTEIGFDVIGKKLVLVDDVLYTGRTVRAAIEAVTDLGRPKLIQLAALIDRGHRELPIKADYVGRDVPTSRSELVNVRIAAMDGIDQVTISGVEAADRVDG